MKRRHLIVTDTRDEAVEAYDYLYNLVRGNHPRQVIHDVMTIIADTNHHIEITNRDVLRDKGQLFRGRKYETIRGVTGEEKSLLSIREAHRDYI